jgi:signal peptidase II
MKQKLKIVAIIAPIVFILDHITKYLIVLNFKIGDQLTIIDGFFDLVHVRNKGAAFGFLSGWDSAYRDVFFYVLGFVALIFLYFFLKDLPSKKSNIIPVGMIFGGALGNIFDRIIRGSVVDFLSFHINNERVVGEILGFSYDFYLIWPSFNVADMGITIGVALLIIQSLKHKKKS